MKQDKKQWHKTDGVFWLYAILGVWVVLSAFSITQQLKKAQSEIHKQLLQSQITYIDETTKRLNQTIMRLSGGQPLHVSLHDPNRRLVLESLMETFVSKRYRFVYLIGVDQTCRHFTFWLDGAPKEKAVFGEPFTPMQPKYWQQVCQQGSPIFFEHQKNDLLAITYLQPLVQNGRVRAILAVDFSQYAKKIITRELLSLQTITRQLLLFSIALFIVALLFATWSYRRSKREKRLYAQIDMLNQKLEKRIQKVTQRIAEENENLTLLLNSIKEGVALSDATHQIVWVNKSLCKILKVQNPSELIGTNGLRFIPPDLKEMAAEYRKKSDYDFIEIVLFDSYQKTFPALVKGVDLVRDGKPLRATFILDISEIKAKEQELFQQSKLAQMGDMISMIAHQWRQPLNAISTSAINLSLQSSLQRLTDEKVQEITQLIQEQAEAMSQTINTFMAFAKPQKHAQWFYLSEAIEEVHNMIGAQMKSHGITIEVDKQADTKIYGHKDLLEQVLLNLYTNARDAFDDIGQYVYSTKQIEDKRIHIQLLQTKNGSGMMLFEDNAGGIPEEVQKQIFNPYYSTKEEGKGTGIGLYMSMKIMKEGFGGKIIYQPIEGGSRFELHFALPNENNKGAP